jgi:hypothetical protein
LPTDAPLNWRICASARRQYAFSGSAFVEPAWRTSPYYVLTDPQFAVSSCGYFNSSDECILLAREWALIFSIFKTIPPASLEIPGKLLALAA